MFFAFVLIHLILTTSSTSRTKMDIPQMQNGASKSGKGNWFRQIVQYKLRKENGLLQRFSWKIPLCTFSGKKIILPNGMNTRTRTLRLVIIWLFSSNVSGRFERGNGRDSQRKFKPPPRFWDHGLNPLSDSPQGCTTKWCICWQRPWWSRGFSKWWLKRRAWSNWRYLPEVNPVAVYLLFAAG